MYFAMNFVMNGSVCEPMAMEIITWMGGCAKHSG